MPCLGIANLVQAALDAFQGEVLQRLSLQKTPGADIWITLEGMFLVRTID